MSNLYNLVKFGRVLIVGNYIEENGKYYFNFILN